MSKTDVFCNFWALGESSAGIVAVECQNLAVFVNLFPPVELPLENEGRVSKIAIFLRFRCARFCPKICPDDLFCYRRSPKIMMVLRFLHARSNLRQIQASSVKRAFLRCLHD